MRSNTRCFEEAVTSSCLSFTMALVKKDSVNLASRAHVVESKCVIIMQKANTHAICFPEACTCT